MTEDGRPRYGYATTPLGQLHYAEQGRGPVVLLLHQTPRSLDEFRELQPLLATEYRTIAMDMPGFGNSAPLPAPQTIEDYARGAAALLHALGVRRAAVIGHHTGGAVAVELAAMDGDLVSALVLSSTPWTDPAFRAAHRHGPGVDDSPRQDDGAHLTTWWAQRRPHYPEPATGLLDRFVRDALAPGLDPREGHLVCARYEMEQRIGLVTAPVLLVGAARDRFALPALASLSAHLAAAASVQTAVIPDGTIPLMEQKPREVAAAVLPFLARHRDHMT
jgi:pimeloyl-ACP methyl ester carboxylesterase